MFFIYLTYNETHQANLSIPSKLPVVQDLTAYVCALKGASYL